MEDWRLIAYLSIGALGIFVMLALYARILAKQYVFLNHCEHEKTRHHVDAVLRCVEEPEQAPEKVITGLMPPR